LGFALIPTRVSIVEVTLIDETKPTERVEAEHGTPGNPMTRDEVIAKADTRSRSSDYHEPHRKGVRHRDCERYPRASALASEALMETQDPGTTNSFGHGHQARRHCSSHCLSSIRFEIASKYNKRSRLYESGLPGTGELRKKTA